MKGLRTIAGFVSDIFRFYWPSQKYRQQTYGFAFLVHPRNQHDMFRKLPWFNLFPASLLSFIERRFWPVTVSNITGLRNLNSNKLIEGFVISIPMTASTMLKERVLALKQIRRAVSLARNKGAKIIGLGALTSSLSRGGLDLVNIPGIAVTTGHAYTGYSVTETFNSLISIADIPINETVVAVVGSAGSIGSISAKILARSGVKKLILVDLVRKKNNTEQLASDLRRDFPSTSIEVTCDFKDLTTAVFVITATNAPGALVEGMHISSGTIIIDDAQPSDVSPELLKRFDVLVVSAGAVHTPNISTNFPMGLAGRYDNYCCLAEVLILASQGRTKNYVINKPTLEMVDEMSEGGKMLGFRVAEYQNTIGLVDENHIENVLKLAAKRHDKI